ncbi:MAG: glycerol-3-phosphate dehydrogenase [Bauldia sp.]|nr:glycerol-3-phosphate dehydrogenase [Bauldia sp.]
MAQVYDLAVIGGGITGCSIARDAAGRGLSVFLCEQGDLAEAGSSTTTSLVDGGFRRRDRFALGALREGVRERERLLAAAPHIVRPLRFVLPFRNRMAQKTLFRAGFLAHDRLAGRRLLPPTRLIDRLDPAIDGALQDDIAGAVEYSDCRVDVSRLVILNAMDARTRGASINPRLRCVIAEREGRVWRLSLESSDSGERFAVMARVLVNATGPWTADMLNHVIDASRPPRIRMVKSTQIVLPRLFDHDRAYAFRTSDRRMIFAMPYAGDYTLVGSADEDFHGDPGDVAADIAESAYLTTTLSAYLRRPVFEDQIVWSRAGVRAIRDDGRAGEPDRDGTIEVEDGEGRAPLISVYGGRITTGRRLAERTVDRVAAGRPAGKAWTSGAALPGGAFEVGGLPSLERALRAGYPFIGERLAARLAGTYGTLAQSIVSGARSMADLGRAFGGNLTEAEARYLVREEWARTADDILWRRSKLGMVFSFAETQALEAWLVEQGPGGPGAKKTHTW